jgi:16S rRNA (uracil1498-N3)-methyltransferase
MAELRRITLSIDQRDGDRFRLTADVRHYLQRVLRLGVGDRCIVADGGGQAWDVELVSATATGKDDDRGELEARILTEVSDLGVKAFGSELSVPLVLVAAVPKGNGFDEVVRQVTELGVASIVPVTSDRTVLDPSPKRVDRWRRIATEAFEQCERSLIPQVLTPQRFDQWLKTQPIHSADRPFPWTVDASALLKVIAVARADAPSLRQVVMDCGSYGNFVEPVKSVELVESAKSVEPVEPVNFGDTMPSGLVIAIGPEGGWTPRERALAVEAGFIEISLGRRVLRAVTASVAAVAIGAEAIET